MSLLAPVHADTHAASPPDTVVDTAVDDSNSGDEPTPVAEGLAPVDVLQASGLFDEVTVDSIYTAIDRAADRGSQALIIQVNTGGAIVSDETMRDLIIAVRDAPVAIGLWVGPSGGSRAYGTPAQLFGVADVTALGVGSRIGYTGHKLDDSVDLGPHADELGDDSNADAHV